MWDTQFPCPKYATKVTKIMVGANERGKRIKKHAENEQQSIGWSNVLKMSYLLLECVTFFQMLHT